MRFVSRVACESERDTSKDNRSFATLPLSSTVAIIATQDTDKLKLYQTARIPSMAL